MRTFSTLKQDLIGLCLGTGPGTSDDAPAETRREDDGDKLTAGSGESNKKRSRDSEKESSMDLSEDEDAALQNAAYMFGRKEVRLDLTERIKSYLAKKKEKQSFLDNVYSSKLCDRVDSSTFCTNQKVRKNRLRSPCLEGGESKNFEYGSLIGPTQDFRINLAQVKCIREMRLNLSTSFELGSLKCTNCKERGEHGVPEGDAVVFILSDQNFPPAMPSKNNCDCLESLGGSTLHWASSLRFSWKFSRDLKSGMGPSLFSPRQPIWGMLGWKFMLTKFATSQGNFQRFMDRP
jgi:hypothetical protein